MKIVVQISEIIRPTNRSLERFGLCQVNSQASKLESLRQFFFPVNLSCFIDAAKLAKCERDNNDLNFYHYYTKVRKKSVKKKKTTIVAKQARLPVLAFEIKVFANSDINLNFFPYFFQIFLSPRHLFLRFILNVRILMNRWVCQRGAA